MSDTPKMLAGRPEADVFQVITANLYAGAFADILDEAGFRNQVISPDLGIRPLDPSMVMVGRALTALNDFDTNADEPYKMAIEAMDQLRAGQIIVTSGVTPFTPGIMGELSATRIRQRGGNGALVNGYTRDARKIMQMGFPTFAKGVSPIDTTGRVRVVDYNCPVMLGDFKLMPNQIIFADFDGIVVIPLEAEDEIIEKALERVEIETKIRAELANGATMDEVWKRYHVL